MLRRIAVALVAIPASVAGIYWGGWILAGVLGVLGAVGAWELYRIGRQTGTWPLVGVGVAAAAALPFLVYWTLIGGAGSQTILLYGGLLFVLVATFAAMLRGPLSKPMGSVSVTILGVVYPSGLLAFILVLRHGLDAANQWGATWLVLFPLVLIWVGDSVAMTGGGIVGGPKIWPTLSPKKTWSGALFGTLSAVLLGPILGVFVLRRFGIQMETWEMVVFALTVSVMGQLGDFAESLFKREANVKDSGSFFSSHGGVLDRLDALYWGAPTAALLYRVFGL